MRRWYPSRASANRTKVSPPEDLEKRAALAADVLNDGRDRRRVSLSTVQAPPPEAPSALD
jgi:hypothetical protein